MDAQHEVTHPVTHLKFVGEVLQLVCTTGNFDYAEAWFPIQSRKYGPVLECYPVFYYARVQDVNRLSKLRRLSESICLPENMGLAGRCAQQREPEWFENVCSLPPSTFLRLECAEEIGFRSTVAIPVYESSELKHVILLWSFASRPADLSLLGKLHEALKTKLGNVEIRDAAGRERERERLYDLLSEGSSSEEDETAEAEEKPAPKRRKRKAQPALSARTAPRLARMSAPVGSLLMTGIGALAAAPTLSGVPSSAPTALQTRAPSPVAPPFQTAAAAAVGPLQHMQPPAPAWRSPPAPPASYAPRANAAAVSVPSASPRNALRTPRGSLPAAMASAVVDNGSSASPALPSLRRLLEGRQSVTPVQAPAVPLPSTSYSLSISPSLQARARYDRIPPQSLAHTPQPDYRPQATVGPSASPYLTAGYGHVQRTYTPTSSQHDASAPRSRVTPTAAVYGGLSQLGYGLPDLRPPPSPQQHLQQQHQYQLPPQAQQQQSFPGRYMQQPAPQQMPLQHSMQLPSWLSERSYTQPPTSAAPMYEYRHPLQHMQPPQPLQSQAPLSGMSYLPPGLRYGPADLLAGDAHGGMMPPPSVRY